MKSFPPDEHLAFMECLTHKLPMGHRDDPFDTSIFEDCAEQAGLWFSRLQACHDSDEAWEVQQDAAQATPSSHKYVPWVEVNGRHIDEDNDDLKTLICDAYQGEFDACN